MFKTPEEARIKARARRRNIRVWFQRFKATLHCKSCGEDHPAALEFHHKDPDKKDSAISHMVDQGHSKRSISREIRKCDVLCSNCHKIHHYNEARKK